MCSMTSTPTVVPIRGPQESVARRASSSQFVQPVESRGLITFRQRRVVEDRVSEIVHRAFERKNRLADVQQLRRAFSYDMHAKQFLCVRPENQLQPAGGVSAN